MLDDLSDGLESTARPPSEAGSVGLEGASEHLPPSFFHAISPALRFLHVVRDGRDMALSENQNQLRKHGEAAPIPEDLPPPHARSRSGAG